MHDTPQRVVWMAGFVAAAVAAFKSAGLVRTTCYAGLAAYCFKRTL